MKPFLIATLAAIGAATCACSSATPAAQPAHTVTVTAKAAAGPSVAPTATPSPATSAAAASCATKNLSASAGSPQGYASGLQLTIMLKNTGTAPCTLDGYPTVTQATGTAGASVGQPAKPDSSAPRMAVTVPPNGVASARLQIADSANYPATTCKQVKASSLAVVPPSEKTALHIAFGSTACDGTAKIMTVTPVQQGSGG
ncbi:MAG TPA: DUF4232 domain-containing protein [Streptosporangiaceae bacterium]|nr:DUF4232 domain-containing protein [Streptosporangiaceae bacterium]